MKACPFCGAEARRSIAPAKGDPLREPALRRGDAHAVSGAAVDEGPRAAGKA